MEKGLFEGGIRTGLPPQNSTALWPLTAGMILPSRPSFAERFETMIAEVEDYANYCVTLTI